MCVIVFPSLSTYVPDKIVRAGSGRSLLGGGSECALVLFTECIDGGVIVRCSSPTALRSWLSTDRLQTGAAVQNRLH